MRAHSRRLLPLLAGAAILILAAPVSLGSQNAFNQSSLLGTWVLDLSRSQYFPGPPPRSETRTYTAAPDGVRAIIKRLHADGHLETIEYFANYDNEVAVTGTEAFDSFKMTTEDEFTAESVLTHAGIAVGTVRRVISRDGKTMAIRFQRRDGAASNTAFYGRQQ